MATTPLTGTVFNPYTITYVDGSGVNATYGQRGEQLVSPLRGKYAAANIRGQLFAAWSAGHTLQLSTNASQIYCLVNPPGSGILVELVRSDFIQTTAAVVVNGLGLYYQTAAQTALWSNLQPQATQSGQLGGPSGKAIFYMTANKSGASTLQAIIGGWGAITQKCPSLNRYDFDGTVIIPPGVGMMISATTANGTALATIGVVSWLEYAA